MADLKISQLTAVTTPLAETEVLPIVQSGVTKKVTVAELTTLINHTMTMNGTNVLQFGDAGYTASINYNGDGSLRIKPRAGYPLQIDLANIKFSNAGYGIDFSATSGTGTSELLDDYEEGTWTVVWTNLTGTPASTTGYYTKIGQVVYFTYATGAGAISGTAGNVRFTLPFTPAQQGVGSSLAEGPGTPVLNWIYTNGLCYPIGFGASYMVFNGTYIAA